MWLTVRFCINCVTTLPHATGTRLGTRLFFFGPAVPRNLLRHRKKWPNQPKTSGFCSQKPALLAFFCHLFQQPTLLHSVTFAPVPVFAGFPVKKAPLHFPGTKWQHMPWNPDVFSRGAHFLPYIPGICYFPVSNSGSQALHFFYFFSNLLADDGWHGSTFNKKNLADHFTFFPPFSPILTYQITSKIKFDLIRIII